MSMQTAQQCNSHSNTEENYMYIYIYIYIYMYLYIYLIIQITNTLLTIMTLQYDSPFSAFGAGVVCAYNINIIIIYYMVQLEHSICNDCIYTEVFVIE